MLPTENVQLIKRAKFQVLSSMDANLAEAARMGNVDDLHNLLQGNPFLFKPAELSGGENPLHIACMEGHADFVKQMLYYRLEFATELNRDGLSPLHIASSYGHIETVRELLKAGPHLCLIEGKDGRIPLHYAVVEGKINIIEELLLANLGSIKKLTAAKETCFHIAIKYAQYPALARLVNHVLLLRQGDIKYLVNMKDDQGNSVLHLTASMKIYDILEFWLRRLNGFVEVNSLNNRNGLTTLDIVVSERGRNQTQEVLREAGAKEANELWGRRMKSRVVSLVPTKHVISGEDRNALLVVIVLIITATYSSNLNPPGGVWAEDGLNTNNGTKTALEPFHIAGRSILATKSPLRFQFFAFFNSIGFFMSVVILTRLTRGYQYLIPFGCPLYAMTLTYISSMFIGDISIWTIFSGVVFGCILAVYAPLSVGKQ